MDPDHLIPGLGLGRACRLSDKGNLQHLIRDRVGPGEWVTLKKWGTLSDGRGCVRFSVDEDHEGTCLFVSC